MILEELLNKINELVYSTKVNTSSDVLVHNLGCEDVYQITGVALSDDGISILFQIATLDPKQGK